MGIDLDFGEVTGQKKVEEKKVGGAKGKAKAAAKGAKGKKKKGGK